MTTRSDVPAVSLATPDGPVSAPQLGFGVWDVLDLIRAWHRQLGLVVIPKSVTPSRIEENFASLEVELTAAELLTISTLDRGWRTGPDPETFNVR